MNLTKAWWCSKTLLSKFEYGKIGKHSYLADPIFIQNKKGIFIGNNVRIYPGMRAELSAPNSRIIFEDDISVGQNLHIVCYKDDLVIGRGTTISGNVFISNVNHDYHELGKPIIKQELKYKNTIIGENCFIGYGVAILPGTELGKQCIVGANSTVFGCFPDYSVIVGSPARVVKRYNESTNKWEKVNG